MDRWLSGKERLKARKAAGLSREKLANMLEVNPSHIWAWEKNVQPSAPIFLRYARLLESLVSGEGGRCSACGQKLIAADQTNVGRGSAASRAKDTAK